MCVTELHCHPVLAPGATEAIKVIDETLPELVIIDVTSRWVNGLECCAALREHTTAPILLLTPINNESHSLEAYQAGASECVIKPISPALLLAKIRVWLGQAWTVQAQGLGNLMIGDLILEPSRHWLLDQHGDKVRLSNLEFRVLYLLMSHPNVSFSNEDLIERVWGLYGEGNATLVKNVIYRLRKKIEPNPNQPKYIHTVTRGYMLRN